MGVTRIDSGVSTSEGQSTLDVLEVKPERPDWGVLDMYSEMKVII